MKHLLLLLAAAALLPAAGRPVQEFPTSAGVVKLTPIRHASLMLEAGGKVIHVDPAQGDYTGLPPADLVLITDVHGDHANPKILDAVKKSGTVIIAPEAVARTVAGAKALANGQSAAFDQWRIEAVPMYNQKRGPSEGKFFHDKGRGNGYVLSYGGKRFYIAGDTEGIPEMRALKNIDVALIPMNLPYTMPPEEAAEAVKAFKPRVAIPYHYRNSDTAVFGKALEGSGVEVRLLDWYY